MDYTRRVMLAGLVGSIVLPALAQKTGSDLKEVIQLLRSVALGPKGTGIFLSEDQQNRALIVAQDATYRGQPPQQVEYRFLRDLLKKEGTARDRFYDPNEVQKFLGMALPPIEGRSLEGDRLYLKIPMLEGVLVSQVYRQLHNFSHDRGIVLDLRGSEGEDPQALADITRIFTSKTPLYSTLTNKDQRQLHSSAVRTLAQEMPMVVLVDAQTRGSAEALASTLQRVNRAQVVGSKSSGDNLRTGVYELPSKAAIRLTMGRWQTEEGGSVSPVIPNQVASGDVLAKAINLLGSQPPRPVETTIFPEQQRIGKYRLGFDAGTGDLGVAGLVENFGPDKDRRPLRPSEDLKIWYLGEYTIFNYRPSAALFTFFADRIYMNSPQARTEKGITLGSTYRQVLSAYGGSEQNGYVERYPFPVSSRGDTPDRYALDYEALGLSFLLSAGSNRVVGIGLYKAGS